MTDVMHRLLEALGGTAMAEVREELGIVGYTLEQRDVVGGRGRGRGGFGPTSFFLGGSGDSWEVGFISLRGWDRVPICPTRMVETWML